MDKQIRKMKWWLIGAGAIIFAFIAALLLPALLKWITSWKCLEGCTFFYVTPQIADWFAFYGSFSSALVSIVLTLITLRFTLRIEEENKKRALQNDEVALIMNIPYLNCKYMELYSNRRNDVLQEYVDIGSPEGDFKIYFQVEATFPTYFQIEITNLEFILGLGDKNPIIKKGEVEAATYVLRSNENLKVYMRPAKSFEEILNKIYQLNYTNPLDSVRSNYLCEMKVTFRLTNKIYRESDKQLNELIGVQLIFKLQNEMYDLTRKCIRLKVIDVQMRRINIGRR